MNDKLTKALQARTEYCRKYGIPLELYDDYKTYCLWIQPDIDKRNWLPFHHYIMDRVDYYIKRGCGTLIIQMPQRAGKTQIAGKLLCSYYLGKNPDKAVLYCTNTNGKAKEFTKEDMYGILFSDKYKIAFPTVKLKFSLDEQENTKEIKEKRKAATLLEDRFGIVDRKGQFNSRGVGAAINGIRAHLLIIDDPFASYEDANSEIIRKKTIEWYIGDAKGRSEANTLKILISTRYHSDDVIGFELALAEKMKQEYPDYEMPEIITFKAEAEQDNEFPYDYRKKGELLIPEFEKKYRETKMSNQVIWQCVYQQNPINVNGLLLKLENFKEYMHELNHNSIYISVDTNMKAEATKGDCAGITIWQTSHPNKYLIDFVNERFNFVELIQCLHFIIEKYPNYIAILIEGRASGDALADILRTKFARIIVVEPVKSKVERFQWCLPEFHAGNIYLPTPYVCPKIMDYKRQLLNFTGNKNGKDDLVDSTSQFLNWIRRNIMIINSNTKLVDYTDNNSSHLKKLFTFYDQPRNYFRR